MKRRQRRPVLEINQPHSGSQEEYVQNKRRQIGNDYPGEHVPANSLTNLLCHYNSDSDTEESKKDICKLDDQVNNFLKEIQLIATKQPISNETMLNSTVNSNTPSTNRINQKALMWRECLDESSGYPYYWHIETNEVTWEMPDELRYLKSNVKSSSIMKQLQESQWVDFSSVTYQQSHENIPEGMIPREVVARNRSRYICSEAAKKQEPQLDQDAANASDTMDNDSDDGKIEMITSYGSDESDSDTGEENQLKKKISSITESTSVIPTVKLRNIETCFLSTPVTQPQLPMVFHNSGPDNGSKDTVVYTNREASLDLKVPENLEADYLKTRIKQNTTSETEECKNKNSNDRTIKESFEKKGSGKNNTNAELDFRVSLVPGYDEDSDVEDESEAKQEKRALFPIPLTDNSIEYVPLLTKTALDENQIKDTNILLNGSVNEHNIEKKNIQDQEDEQIQEKTECREEYGIKVEDESQKSNKFLDNLSGRSKCFQRKKRIAFDVTSTKIINDENETNKTEDETQREELNPCDERATVSNTDPQEQCDTVSENVAVNFSNLKDEPNSILEEINISSETSNELKENEVEVNLLSQIVLEKLKFLSEGKPNVSPIQMMSIQLQTLYVAWEGGYLEKTYLRRWLSDTSHELERLEQDAAPPGWLCQWDRSHKRYYYQNTITGVTQWTYPDTGIAGGAEEMEICSTPPPIEQEEIIEPVQEEDGLKLKSKKLQESNEAPVNMTAPRTSDIEAPPPPQISNPSPPPPPKIYAEDLKKDKRKQDKYNSMLENDKQQPKEEGTVVTEVKQLENPVAISHSSAILSPQPTNLVSVTSAEPLPPGVDLTEAPYEIPATALKRIIYGAVQSQGNALYDATARDPTVPILSHPAAIVQEHYLQYPTYHQHLHASAALVLPHKHSVSPAIQLIPDYTPIYTNHKVIEKPPIKTAKESLVSALDSFYSDIARIENTGTEIAPQRQDTSIMESSSLLMEETKVEETSSIEIAVKEKKRKKTRIGTGKKHKEMSSMVAKWQKVQQNFENT